MPLRAAIITGAGTGIGRACAESLFDEGYFVYLLGRRKLPLEKTLQINEKCGEVILCDLDSETSILKAVEHIQNRLTETKQKLCVLLNNAGVFEQNKFIDIKQEVWQTMFQTNLFGPAYLTQLLLPNLLSEKEGAIINISSTLGQRSVPGTSVYSASKAAMISWSETLALELAPQNIRVNCVAPGVIDTPIHSFFDKSDDNSIQNRKMMAEAHPLKKIGTPQDVAAAVLYLIKAPWVTGTTIQIDGGIHL